MKWDKVNADGRRQGLYFKERQYAGDRRSAEREQPEYLRKWFRERLIAHCLALVNCHVYLTSPNFK